MNPPYIATSRLQFRPWCRDDLDMLHRLWTDPAVRRYLLDDLVISRERALEFVEATVDSWTRTGLGMWSLWMGSLPDVVGFAGLHWLNEGLREAELKYGLAPKYWGQGLATEASIAVLRDGFRRLRLDHIWASTDPPNADSVRVMQRLGMTPAECPLAAAGLVSCRITRPEYQGRFEGITPSRD